MKPSDQNSNNAVSDKPPSPARRPAWPTSRPPIFTPQPANHQPAISDRDGLTPEQLTEICAQRAYALAQKPPAEVSGDTLTLLMFWVGQEQYGVDVTNVREIYPLEQLTPVPRTPDFVAGVFSARGRILSVIDLRAFYGLPSVPKNGCTGTRRSWRSRDLCWKWSGMC